MQYWQGCVEIEYNCVVLPLLCLWCKALTSSPEHYLRCVSSSQSATRVGPFLSTFNWNLAHYKQTTKALFWHSGAHASEWWIFPITLLSIHVSGKHRSTETAFRNSCSYVCLTQGKLSAISTKISTLKGKVEYTVHPNKSIHRIQHPRGYSAQDR